MRAQSKQVMLITAQVAATFSTGASPTGMQMPPSTLTKPLTASPILAQVLPETGIPL